MNKLNRINVLIGTFVLAFAGIGGVVACSDAEVEAYTEKVRIKPVAVMDDLKSETRNVSGFDSVSIANTISADVKAGQAFEVIVSAREDVLPHVITKVNKETLLVEFDEKWWKSLGRNERRFKVRVSISMPELKDLDVSGASTASVSGVNSDSLTIDISGASVVSMTGNAREANIDLSGASVLKADQLYTEVAEMDLSGASSAKLNVSNELSVDASGASSVRYSGEPTVRKETSGASSVSRN